MISKAERSEYDRLRYQANRIAILSQHRDHYRENRATEMVRKSAYNKANRLAINLSQKIGLPLAVCRRMLEEQK